jgi:hypothetical protein
MNSGRQTQAECFLGRVGSTDFLRFIVEFMPEEFGLIEQPKIQ